MLKMAEIEVKNSKKTYIAQEKNVKAFSKQNFVCSVQKFCPIKKRKSAAV
jgi:hypothetical protein